MESFSASTMSLTRQLSSRVPQEHLDVIMWRDTRKSGMVFGGSTVAYILLGWAPISFSVLGLQAFTVLVATTLLWHLGSNALGRPGPPVPEVLVQGFSEEALVDLARKYRPLINLAVCVVGRLLSGTDAALSLKVFAAGVVLSWVAARVSLLTAAYVVVFVAFTGPKVYELKQREIDQAMSVAGNKLKEVYAKFDQTVLKRIHKGKQVQAAAKAQ